VERRRITMTRSAHSTRRRRRRLFRAVTVALAALALTMPTSALADWPASEKTSGLDTSSDAPAPITNEKLDDLLDTVPSSDERRVADAPTFVSGADDKVIVPVGAPGLYPDAPRVVGAWAAGSTVLTLGSPRHLRLRRSSWQRRQR
jgi:hypothetical protein